MSYVPRISPYLGKPLVRAKPKVKQWKLVKQGPSAPALPPALPMDDISIDDERKRSRLMIRYLGWLGLGD
jgi:hypothetical protein